MPMDTRSSPLPLVSDATSQLMLFTGNANKALAQDIANYLRVPLGKADYLGG